MWFKLSIFFILFAVLFASPPGSRESAYNKSQINSKSRDDKETQPSTSFFHVSKYNYGSEPQQIPLDLSTKNRQPDRYGAPSTSGAKYKSFDCSQCPKSFTTDKRLRTHMSFDHEGKKAICRDCGKSFNNDNYLYRHRLSDHRGIRFDCTKCGRQFSQKGALESHDRAEHQGIKFDCTKCGRTYVSKQSLVNHDRAEHQDNSEFHKCDKCPYQTKHKGSFTSHQHRHH